MKAMRKWAILPTVLALFLLDSHSIDSLARSGNALLAASVDPAGLLGQRSPGMRMDAVLRSKPAVAVAPQERVLADMRSRPDMLAPAAVPGLIESALNPDAVPGGPGVPGVGSGPITSSIPAPPGIGNVPFLIVPPLGAGGGSGGGSGGGGGGGLPFDPPPVVSPVPEPSTWMFMIFGIGIAGVALRRKRQDRRPTAVA